MSGTAKKPEIVVFAGPNGSGKTTIGALLRPVDMPYVNADDIQRILGCDNLTAAQMAERQREEHLQQRRSFCFEAVLSTPRNLDLLKRAKEAGYFIRCCYVLTVDPCINIARVAARVMAGGHDAPKDKIISRYEKALALVKELIPVCDVCHVFDNSTECPYRIFKKRKSDCRYCTEPHLWLKADISALTGIADAEKASLNKLD